MSAYSSKVSLAFKDSTNIREPKLKLIPKTDISNIVHSKNNLS